MTKDVSKWVEKYRLSIVGVLLGVSGFLLANSYMANAKVNEKLSESINTLNVTVGVLNESLNNEKEVNKKDHGSFSESIKGLDNKVVDHEKRIIVLETKERKMR